MAGPLIWYGADAKMLPCGTILDCNGNPLFSGPTVGFTIIQPDTGTSPTADSTSDTLSVVGDGVNTRTSGNSLTDTLTIELLVVQPTKGGTGLSTYVQGDIIYASAADTLARLPKSTTASRYLSNQGTSNNPAWLPVNLANGVTGDLPFANLTQIAATSVLGVAGGSTADVAAITASADNQVLRRASSSSLGFALLSSIPSDVITNTDSAPGTYSSGEFTLTGAYSEVIFCKGNVAGAVMTLPNGTVTGQMVELIGGTGASTAHIEIDQADSNLRLNGSCLIYEGSSLKLRWGGTKWTEMYRNGRMA